MTKKSDLRLATWNIHMGVGCDGNRNLARTAGVVQRISPDLIGLQEVDNQVGESGDDLQKMAEMTRMRAVAGPTMRRENGDYGNALLTTLPVLDVERYDLSVGKREPRGLLIVRQRWGDEDLWVAVTHLGLRPFERRNQVQHLIDCLSAKNRKPLILMGDFNEWFFWGRPMRWLHRYFGSIRSPRTFPAIWPLLSLDHILGDPPDRLHTKRVFRSPPAREASDHLPLTAIFSS
jgi:endonuclease/exonuclease/phosphatase family metal-dependent hydrolase